VEVHKGGALVLVACRLIRAPTRRFALPRGASACFVAGGGVVGRKKWLVGVVGMVIGAASVASRRRRGQLRRCPRRGGRGRNRGLGWVGWGSSTLVARGVAGDPAAFEGRVGGRWHLAGGMLLTL
jgi:hypothetical protein